MNYLWGGMIIIGIIYGACTGNMQAVTDAAITSSREAVSLCISMAGVLALWSGLMEIAKDAGLIDRITSAMGPIITFLFPDIPKNHLAREYLSTNIIANLLGLGWAATPAGLQAMEQLEKLEEERRKQQSRITGRQDSQSSTPVGSFITPVPKGTASKEMCTFLIINISSLQLIPVNIIAYRSQYGSINPTAIVGPAIVATLVSTLVGIVFCKVKNGK